MNERRCRVLILDLDQDTLITLQHVLEDAGVDTTTTWDETEARQLVENRPFDLVLLGDHPPEIKAETILGDCRIQGGSYACLILRRTVLETDIEHFRGLGVIDVVCKRDPLGVLEQVQEHCCPQGVKAKPAATDLAKGHFWRAAS